MRLICPNCDAQYEVAAGAIPAAGRDVQCSSCDHTWFFVPHPESAEPGGAWQEQPGIAAVDHPRVARPAYPVREARGQPSDGNISGDDPADDDPADGRFADGRFADGRFAAGGIDDRGGAPVAAPRRPLDDKVLAVLRDEADRETRARQAETSGAAAVAPTRAEVAGVAAARATPIDSFLAPGPAALRGANEDEGSASPRPAYRDAAPDMRNTGPAPRAVPVADVMIDAGETLPVTGLRRRRSGFGAGFVAVVVLAALLAGVYLAGPAIGSRLPALAPALESYTLAVDGARRMLNDGVEQLSVRMSGGDTATGAPQPPAAP